MTKKYFRWMFNAKNIKSQKQVPKWLFYTTEAFTGCI
jgi:hypothetical protein